MSRIHYDLATGRPHGRVIPRWFGWALVDLSGFIRDPKEGA